MVSDTGQGLAPEDLLRIFNKFQQFGRGSDAGDKGTGLGLAISKGIIEAQGGKIGVKSKLGQGTDFTFTLQKYDRDAVLREKINTKMAKARGKEAAFYLFSLRIENYSKIEEKPGESKMKNIVREIAKSLENSIRHFTVVEESAQGRLIVLIEHGRESFNTVKNKTKRAIKDAIFELSGGLPVDFSYGWAAYPQDGLDADKLLQKAYAGMVSEKEERLGKNILIIDDEPMIRGALKRSLQGAGYSSVDEAGDGEDGLAKIKASVPGLVILDIRMPKMNGYEVIGRLRENTETKDIPVLIMSGYEVESGKLEDHLKKKAIPIIAKPFEMEQVLRLVDYLL
jgi:CheY-like chemotaxis protein